MHQRSQNCHLSGGRGYDIVGEFHLQRALYNTPLMPPSPELQAAIAASRSDSPYERLGVVPQSSLAERKQAYRARSRILHPDIIQDVALKPICNDALARINAAFEILSDPIRELAWRAKQGFTVSGGWGPQSGKAQRYSRDQPPPESSNGEIRGLTELVRAVIRNFSREGLEQLTRNLIDRLLYARDCRAALFDPALRFAIEELISSALAASHDAAVLSLCTSLVRLFLFQRSDPSYQQLVNAILALITTILSNDDPPSELGDLFIAIRSLDEGGSFLRDRHLRTLLENRLRRAFLSCRLDKSRDVDRVILLKLQEVAECIPPETFITIQSEAYRELLSQEITAVDAADIRRRLHISPDDATASLTKLFDQSLETRAFVQSSLYAHLLLFDIGRQSELLARSEAIAEALIDFFRGFCANDPPQLLSDAVRFLKQLPEPVLNHLSARRVLRRSALGAYYRYRRRAPSAASQTIPAPDTFLSCSFIDKLCGGMLALTARPRREVVDFDQ